MKTINEEVFLTIGETARLVKRSAQTIKNWYKWCEGEGVDFKEAGLPLYRRDLDAKQTYHFAEADIPKLEKFRDSIVYGQMSDFNSSRWGQRGKDIESRKVEVERLDNEREEIAQIDSPN